MNGLCLNDSIQKLDLSDNDLKDDAAIFVLSMIKSQNERKNNNIWCDGLRDRDKVHENSLEKIIPIVNIQTIDHDVKYKKEKPDNSEKS